MRDISDFLLLMFLLSLFALMSGLISPKLVIWIWGESNKTRKEVLRYFGTTAVALFIIYGISTEVFRPKHKKESIKSVQPVEKQNENVAVDTVSGMMPSGNIRVATKLLKEFTKGFGGGPEYSTPGWREMEAIEVSGHSVWVKTRIYPSPVNKKGIAQDTCSQILGLLYSDDPDYLPLDTVDIAGKYEIAGNDYVTLTQCYKLKRR